MSLRYKVKVGRWRTHYMVKAQETVFNQSEPTRHQGSWILIVGTSMMQSIYCHHDLILMSDKRNHSLTCIALLKAEMLKERSSIASQALWIWFPVRNSVPYFSMCSLPALPNIWAIRGPWARPTSSAIIIICLSMGFFLSVYWNIFSDVIRKS